MRVYVDNSVLTAFYAPEPSSAEVIEILTSANIDPAVSNLTEVEFFSAIAKKLRTGEIEAVTAKKIRQRFVSHLENFLYARLPLRTSHFRLATNWLSDNGPSLTTLDALHVAVACFDDRKLLTADKGQAKAALELGVEVELLGG